MGAVQEKSIKVGEIETVKVAAARCIVRIISIAYVNKEKMRVVYNMPNGDSSGSLELSTVEALKLAPKIGQTVEVSFT